MVAIYNSIEDVTYVNTVTCSNQKSWLSAEAYTLLRTQGAAFTLCDSETTCPRPTEKQSVSIHRKATATSQNRKTECTWRNAEAIINHTVTPCAFEGGACFLDFLNDFQTCGLPLTSVQIFGLLAADIRSSSSGHVELLDLTVYLVLWGRDVLTSSMFPCSSRPPQSPKCQKSQLCCASVTIRPQQ